MANTINPNPQKEASPTYQEALLLCSRHQKKSEQDAYEYERLVYRRRLASWLSLNPHQDWVIECGTLIEEITGQRPFITTSNLNVTAQIGPFPGASPDTKRFFTARGDLPEEAVFALYAAIIAFVFRKTDDLRPEVLEDPNCASLFFSYRHHTPSSVQ